MSRIFVSYSSKDRDFVTSLVSDLETLGHELWFDAELTRTGGQKWWSNILANLRDCDLFIFALTPNSLASEPCRREYSYAHALRKRILPVMLGTVDVSLLPVALQEIQFVDYRDRTSKQAVALAATLNNLPVVQPMPDPPPPEPPTPLSPLAELSQRLDAPSLAMSEQVELLFELETMLDDPATRGGAETLLRRLYGREDLTNRVGDKIQDLLAEKTAPQPPPPAARTPDQNGDAANTLPGYAAAIIAWLRKIIVDVIAPPTQPPAAAHASVPSRPGSHNRWLKFYFLLPILICVWLLWVGWFYFGPVNPSFYSLDWLFPAAVGSTLLTLAGIVGTWRWKKRGVYFLIVALVASALLHIAALITYYSSSDPYAVTWIVITLTVLGVSLVLLRRVLWNEWQFFEGQQ